MRKGKVEMKLIDDKSSRQVTFSKRRSGLFKKARELSVLCDADVAVIIYSSRGKLYEFSGGNSLRNIMDRHQMQIKSTEATGRTINEVEYAKKCRSEYEFYAAADFLQIVQRQLNSQKVEELNITEVIQLEHRLDAILQQTRTRKAQLMMESFTAIHDKDLWTNQLTGTGKWSQRRKPDNRYWDFGSNNDGSCELQQLPAVGQGRAQWVVMELQTPTDTHK